MNSELPPQELSPLPVVWIAQRNSHRQPGSHDAPTDLTNDRRLAAKQILGALRKFVAGSDCPSFSRAALINVYGEAA